MHNLTQCPPIWPLTSVNEHCSVKLYAWNRDEEAFPSLLPVQVQDRELTAPLNPDRILVRVNRQWIPLQQWLEEETNEV